MYFQRGRKRLSPPPSRPRNRHHGRRRLSIHCEPHRAQCPGKRHPVERGTDREEHPGHGSARATPQRAQTARTGSDQGSGQAGRYGCDQVVLYFVGRRRLQRARSPQKRSPRSSRAWERSPHPSPRDAARTPGGRGACTEERRRRAGSLSRLVEHPIGSPNIPWRARSAGPNGFHGRPESHG